MNYEDLLLDLTQDIYNAMKRAGNYVDGKINTGGGSFVMDDWLFAEAEETAKKLINKYHIQQVEQ